MKKIQFEIAHLRKKDINDFVRHWSESYPGLGINTTRKIKERCKLFESFIHSESEFRSQWYSVKKTGKIVGGFRLFHQFVNVHRKELMTQALGHVFVSLNERKAGVSKEIMTFVHEKATKDDVSLSMLYPFRAQFYKNFGYGQSTPRFSYLVKPEQFKDSHFRRNVIRSFSTKEILSFYDKAYKVKSGFSKRTEATFKNYLSQEKKIFLYKENQEISGYILLEIVSTHERNFLKNLVIVHELLYLEPQALKGILGFLNSLNDQVDEIFLSVSNPSFYFNIVNPEIKDSPIVHPVYQISHQASLGTMYRINNISKFIKHLKGVLFGLGDLLLKFNILDDFSLKIIDSVSVSFSDGNIKLESSKTSHRADAFIEISLSHFSALFMGSISFQDLYEFGFIKIKEVKLIDKMNHIFSTLVNPQNLDIF